MVGATPTTGTIFLYTKYVSCVYTVSMSDKPTTAIQDLALMQEEDDALDNPLSLVIKSYPAHDEPTHEITETSRKLDIQKDDVKQYNHILRQLKTTWGYIRDVNDVCKLALTHAKVLDQRKKSLFPDEGKASGPKVFDVYDD